MAFIVVFNPTEHSVVVDAEGRVAEPHKWAVADKDLVAGMLAAGTIFETDVSQLKEEDSNPAVIMAKKELAERLRLAKPKTKPAPAADSSATETVKE